MFCTLYRWWQHILALPQATSEIRCAVVLRKEMLGTAPRILSAFWTPIKHVEMSTPTVKQRDLDIVFKHFIIK